MHGSESWSVMPAIPLSTPVHPGDRTPADPAVLNVPFAHSGKSTLTLKEPCKGRAHEQINTWFTGYNTFHGGVHLQITVEKADM